MTFLIEVLKIIKTQLKLYLKNRGKLNDHSDTRSFGIITRVLSSLIY